MCHISRRARNCASASTKACNPRSGKQGRHYGAAFFFSKGPALRVVTWILRLVLFALLFGFALKNTDPVSLRFYFDYAWSAPLILLLLFFFVGGVIVGWTASMAKVFRQRREILNLKREQRGRTAVKAETQV